MIRLGIVGCSEIAYRRFMPAVKEVAGIEVVGVAEEYAPEKLDDFCDTYGIDGYDSFEALFSRNDVDAIYVPQPPALHFKYAKRALELNKHVLVEKPSTVTAKEAKILTELANERQLALHENYMFQYHSQIDYIRHVIEDGVIGEVRLYRADFGFPIRQQNDFRYIKRLGGGALYDAGGYVIKLATLLLGDTIQIDTAHGSYVEGYEVDMYGNLTMSNDEGVIFQGAFGMDNAYRCSLDVWGSKGSISTNRILTAPADYTPEITVTTANGSEKVTLEPDSSFCHSIEEFCKEVTDVDKRNNMYRQIILQAELMERVRNESGI